ncbi:S-adenosylmethionine:tRNA ribosyltransferase-isomerase [Salmonella enterica]|uniref:S-adenosylmethionine:tRNA ribosyltransferase-isomerase n=1 Tax=Salmonella typhimurium TaxID=90371 RepID=A0A735XTS3_SALTM|nr:S-adenosylmethionine:tRNA ribosyltransferase-isomerase [Salmonella enterica]HAE7264198.1 S-adenosylmethionine:tRNA ribosyltransferase-isomerase [Salmonella enterica subsp. enterica serovar Typhimurium]
MLTEKYDFRITDQMTIPLRPHWIANDSYREKCKMLVLNRSKGEIHKVDFSKLTDYIKEGDVICFSDSTIINHMFICKTRQNRLIKIVLEGFLPNNRVIISGLLKERLNANDVFYLVDNPEISIKIEQRFSEESQYRAVVENHEALICYLASHGERLDEYVDSSLFYKYPDAYRSVFSKKYGSLEIPSAGIHFTWDLIQRIKDKGGLISFITLHVASTEMLSNRKIQTKCVEEVTINEEYYEVPQATADIINTAKQNGGRIFAVGTTVTRCLESAYSREHNCLKASSGWTALYIHPGYQLKVVDCLLTNLHQPKTTHMVLTGQFAGVDLLIKAYTSEHIQSCQFDMFGDCMLIIQDEGQG